MLTCDFVVVINHEIELVEVSVNETEGGKLHDEVHQVRIQLGRVVDVVDLAQRIRVHQFHHDGVTTGGSGKHAKTVFLVVGFWVHF